MVFTSDNGGPVQDEGTMSNNYPLRGLTPCLIGHLAASILSYDRMVETLPFETPHPCVRMLGGKNTIWNGGTNVVGMIAGAGIQNPGRISHEKMHASDWLPSLVSMAIKSGFQSAHGWFV